MVNETMVGSAPVIFSLILLIPLVSGLIAVFFKAINQRRTLSITLSLVIVFTIALLILGEIDFETGLFFLREPITFSISQTGLLLYLANLFALGLILLFTVKRELVNFHALLLNLSLIFGFIALMSGQFMIRYIALDIVGLLVSASVLTTFARSAPLMDFKLIFQVLRLGDLSLLASILLINHQAGTLDIASMIIFSTEMSTEPRAWLFAGFIIAILVKLAVWPFGIWLGRARRTATREAFWISGFLMPTLGFYLLYRIAPIIHASTSFQIFTFATGLSFGLIMFLVSQFGLIGHHRFYHTGSLYACFVLVAIAFPNIQGIGYYFIGLILFRALIEINTENKHLIFSWIVFFFPFLLNMLFILVNVNYASTVMVVTWAILSVLALIWDWHRFAERRIKLGIDASRTEQMLDDPFVGERLIEAANWLNRTVENNLLSEGVLKLSNSFVDFAQWLYQTFEVNLFAYGVTKLSHLVTSAANWLQDRVDQGLENSWTWVGQKFMKISEVTWSAIEKRTPEKVDVFIDDAMQSIRDFDRDTSKKTSRWDLVLIPLFLIVILTFLFIF